MVGVPETEERSNRVERFREIIVENFPTIMKNINVQHPKDSINSEQDKFKEMPTLRYIIMKLSKFKDREFLKQ